MNVKLIGGPADGMLEESKEILPPYSRIIIPIALSDEVCIYETTREGTAIYLATIKAKDAL